MREWLQLNDCSHFFYFKMEEINFMITINKKISFDTYVAIVEKVTNDCFVDGVYSPALYELSFRNALLSGFAPDFDMSDCEDNNALWAKVNSVEAMNLLDEIYDLNDYFTIRTAIGNNIAHRRAMIESGSMSLSDYALSKLFNVITDKVAKTNTDVLTPELADALIKASKASGKKGFEERLVRAFDEAGLIEKTKEDLERKAKIQMETYGKKNTTTKKKTDGDESK